MLISTVWFWQEDERESQRAQKQITQTVKWICAKGRRNHRARSLSGVQMQTSEAPFCCAYSHNSATNTSEMNAEPQTTTFRKMYHELNLEASWYNIRGTIHKIPTCWMLRSDEMSLTESGVQCWVASLWDFRRLGSAGWSGLLRCPLSPLSALLCTGTVKPLPHEPKLILLPLIKLFLSDICH